MAITPAELATVRYVDYDYWVELSGGTRLAADAAPRIRAGVAPFGVSSAWALGMARAVAGGARFPPLILVTTGPSGNLVVLEGHCRLTAYMLRPDRLPPELEVLVGSSPDIAGWAQHAGSSCSALALAAWRGSRLGSVAGGVGARCLSAPRRVRILWLT